MEVYSWENHRTKWWICQQAMWLLEDLEGKSLCAMPKLSSFASRKHAFSHEREQRFQPAQVLLADLGPRLEVALLLENSNQIFSSVTAMSFSCTVMDVTPLAGDKRGHFWPKKVFPWYKISSSSRIGTLKIHPVVTKCHLVSEDITVFSNRPCSSPAPRCACDPGRKGKIVMIKASRSFWHLKLIPLNLHFAWWSSH